MWETHRETQHAPASQFWHQGLATSSMLRPAKTNPSHAIRTQCPRASRSVRTRDNKRIVPTRVILCPVALWTLSSIESPRRLSTHKVGATRTTPVRAQARGCMQVGGMRAQGGVYALTRAHAQGGVYVCDVRACARWGVSPRMRARWGVHARRACTLKVGCMARAQGGVYTHACKVGCRLRTLTRKVGCTCARNVGCTRVHKLGCTRAQGGHAATRTHGGSKATPSASAPVVRG